MKAIRWATFVTSLLIVGGISAAPSEGQVTVKVVKYAELGKIIRDLRGQVVLIDFWGIT